MADKESILALKRSQSVAPELVLEVAAENLRRSQHECELSNPKFVADHAKSKLQEFTFVVCGAPRTGKSTLINAILNKELAPTKSGPSAITLETNCYTLEGLCPERINEQTGEKLQETQTFRINIWDTKGITTWDKKIADIVNEKNPMCLILCSSPGSFAKDEFIRPLINQCVVLKVFIALVCTNQWNDSDEKRTKVMEEFKDLLAVSYYVEYLIKIMKFI
jgi:GTPase SAR1 family protein